MKGLIAGCQWYAEDQVTPEVEDGGCLETVFEDGVLKKEYTLKEVRQRINEGLYGKPSIRKRGLQEATIRRV